MSNFEKFMHFMAIYMAAAGTKEWVYIQSTRNLRRYFPDSAEIDAEERAWEYFYYSVISEGRSDRPKWLDPI